MSGLNNIELVINEIKGLIEDTVMTENEGSRRCLNSDDLNVMEVWIELLQQANGVSDTNEQALHINSVSSMYCDNCKRLPNKVHLSTNHCKCCGEKIYS